MGEDFNDMGSPQDKPGDRILCIYPDGKIKVFATNLYAVFGLQYIDGKVYVHHSPKFSVFDDDNGVGVHRVDLIASDNPHPWAPTFNDHIPSGFHLGMDGYFYISTGDKGILGAVGTDGRKIEMRGGIYRMRPDGTGLEVYCTGTRNHLDIGFNDEDELFTYDNTDDGGGWWSRVTHMVDGGYYGYPYDYRPQRPYTLWRMEDYGTGAATGVVCYTEDALPEEYRENLFLCEWAGAQIYRLKIKPSGSTYEVVSRVQYDGSKYLTATHMGAIDQDFVTRGGFDIAFRPVGICITPDGMGFYVTDWGLSGWKNGQVLGRLFKITYTGKSLAAPKPKWFVAAATGKKFNASTAELIRALSHPAKSVRMVAQRRLADRRQAAEAKLAALLNDTKARPYARWSAIWALDAIDGGKKEHKAILAALKDKDPTVQAQAARELGTRQAKDAVGPLIGMLDSTNLALRFRAATALGRIGDRNAVWPLKKGLVQTDLFARYAAFKALNRIGLADSNAWPKIVEGMASVNPRIREGSYFAVRETYDLALVKALTGFLSRHEIATEPRTNILNLLSSLYQKAPPWNGDWWNTMPVNGSPPAKTVSWDGSPVVAAAMRDALQDPALAMRTIAFEWVKTSHDPNAAEMLRAMFEHETDPAMRTTILRALPAADDPPTRALIAPLLRDPKTPVSLQQAAIEIAEKMDGNEWNDDFIRLAQHPANDGMLLELFKAFGKNKISEMAPMLGENLTNSSVALRDGAIAALTDIGGDAAITQFLPGLDSQSEEICRRSIQALGKMHAKTAVQKLIKLSTITKYNTAAIEALTQMPDMAALDVYLDGLASKSAALRSECRTAVTALRDPALPKIEARIDSTNGLPDDSIATLKQIYLTDATAKKGPIFRVKIKIIPVEQYQSYALQHDGDYNRGKEIFSDANGANCIRCHSINGLGGKIGPELTGISMKQDRAQIIESVLYPSKVILDGYQQVFFYMDNDDDYSGIVRSELADTVTIINSRGETNVLQKSKILRRKVSQISLMPEGLQVGMTLDDFSSLIAYVENRKPAFPPKGISKELANHPNRPPPGMHPPGWHSHGQDQAEMDPPRFDPAVDIMLELPPLPIPSMAMALPPPSTTTGQTVLPPPATVVHVSPPPPAPARSRKPPQIPPGIPMPPAPPGFPSHQQ